MEVQTSMNSECSKTTKKPQKTAITFDADAGPAHWQQPG